ncbi:MAG: MFS transporter [Candidatus Bipolaricaulota bacterium]|nr:MFS transporter [Candidatus Bipolaricaulota bacterium]
MGRARILPAMDVQRRNALVFFGEATLFGVGVVFIGFTTVLPQFVSELTGSTVLVGLVIALAEGAWRAPQLAVVWWLLAARRKKPWLTRAGLVARPAYLVLGIALWVGAGSHPALTLGLFLVLHGIMFLFLSVDHMVWWDVFAKAIPAGRRGRVLGASTVARGVLAVGAGGLITWLLGEGGPGFPRAYAALFSLTGILLLLSLGSWSLVVEPDEEPVGRPPLRGYFEQLAAVLRGNRTFRSLVVIRLVSGCEGLALGFYPLLGTQVLGFSPAYIGVFAAVQTVGGIAAGLGLGLLSERAGIHRVIQVATAASASAPVVALLFLWTGLNAHHLLGLFYPWVFAAIGVSLSANFIGFANGAVELAPPGERGMYIGLFSTLSGLAVLPPVLGGWLLARTSYATLLALTASLVLLGHALSWRLGPIGGRASPRVRPGPTAPLQSRAPR